MLLGMSVAECQRKVDSAEFAEWLAFFNLEPMPNSWLQHGVLCQLISSALGSKTAKPEDFMPRTKKIQSAGQMQAIAKSWASAVNAGRKQ